MRKIGELITTHWLQKKEEDLLFIIVPVKQCDMCQFVDVIDQ